MSEISQWFATEKGGASPLLAELAAVALDAARGAAAVLAAGAAADAHVTGVSTKISATDMVSDVDRAAEAAVNAVLSARRPDDAVLGEEGTSTAGSTGVQWVVDPLDGTTNFLFGIPQFCVSVAAEIDGAPVVGVVIDPSRPGRTDTWAAVSGCGSVLNGRPCRAAIGRSELSTALCATGFGYRPERRRWQGDVLARIISSVRDVRRFGSAALDLCWVGGGRYDAYFESGLNPWDRSAGSLVASEAGARVEIVGAGMVLAAVPELWDPLCALLESAGALDAPPGPEKVP
jgi:myo-inositol-1(or 4)-monophosphatase